MSGGGSELAGELISAVDREKVFPEEEEEEEEEEGEGEGAGSGTDCSFDIPFLVLDS